MKKIIVMALAISSLLSCSNSDDDNSNATVDGSWKLTSFTTGDPSDFNNDGTLTTNFINETGCYNDSGILFSSGGSALVEIQELDITFNVGSQYPLGYFSAIGCIDATPETLTWSQNGNTVTIDGLDFALSGNTLTGIVPEFTEVMTLEGGVTVTRITSATLVFTKQ